MRATRSATLSFSVLLALLLALALALPTKAGDEAGPLDTVTVLCEAWRVTAPEVLADVEAITERRPDGAEEVRRQRLGAGGERLARLLTPTADDKPVLLSDLRRVPLQVTAPRGGATTGGFAGFQEIGAQLQLTQHPIDGRTVEIELELKVQGAGASGADNVPGTQTTTQLITTVVAPYGVLRMFVSRAGDGDAVVVFVRASTLGEETARLERPEAGGGGFSDREIQRFEALKALVDLKERKEQLETMIGRQLARLGVELSDEQHSVVVERTLAYREALRERMRAGVDRETMQAEMEALRQDYADGLATVLDEATVEKVVEGLGRAPGFGRGRER